MDDGADAHNQSLASSSAIEQDLHRLITQHPQSGTNDDGEPIIPASALIDVLQSFADIYNGIQIMNSEDIEKFNKLLAENPGVEVTPRSLMMLVTAKAQRAFDIQQDHPGDHSYLEVERALTMEDSLSDESNGSISLSRPPSRGAGGIGKYPSPFDAERRQRSQPLMKAAPSSWNNKRPMPAARRKSLDAGNRSDSESFSSPGGHNRSSSRQRPSNPTSPNFSHSATFSPIGSPPGPPSTFYGLSQTFNRTGSYSRPPSRSAFHSHSHSQPSMSHITSPPPSSFADPSDYTRTGYSSSDDNLARSTSTTSLYDRGRRVDSSFMLASRSSISPLPPTAMNLDGTLLDLHNDLTRADLSDMSGSSSDEEDSALGLVMDRTVNASTASLEPLERVDALQRANAELRKKLMEAESTLQRKLLEHESELEEMQSRLDEMKTELTATKREEKELRSKERQNMTQIAALEAEIAKVTRALDHARVTYSSLQKQYQEQCAASEKYRDDLRIREEAIRTLREAASFHELEAAKWGREQDSYEDRISHLESELVIAQQAHAQLDEQKQENLLLKETIDRMRFEMDEMRSGLNLGVQQGLNGLPGSGRNTISKSLGDELAEKMKWDIDGDSEGEGVERREGDSMTSEEGSSFNSETAVELDTESAEEDVIQTIITKRKRKVASRANKPEVVTTQIFEESKEYSDSTTQYDPGCFFAEGTQTEPEPEPPKVVSVSVDVQTEEVDPPLPTPHDMSLPRVLVEMEVQTDADGGSAAEDDEQHDESLASSSSTIKPPTPRPTTPAMDIQVHHDEPPAYTSITPSSAGPSSLSLGLESDERDWRMAAELLKKWHRGAKIPIDGVPGGVSEEAAEEWRLLKEELGVECLVIDKIMERSAKIPGAPPHSRTSGAVTPMEATAADAVPGREAVKSGIGRIGRFYNIYNTYVYGTPQEGESKASNSAVLLQTLTSFARQAAIGAGAFATLLFFMGPYMAPAPYGAGPTYLDRSAWNSFNALHAGAGEGLVGPTGRFGFGGGWFGGGAGYPAGAGGGAAVDGTAAVWNILGRVGGGAARMARGLPT